jgi:amino acid adenylation domain-containing protein
METQPLKVLLHSRVAHWIEKTPDALAVSSKDCSYSYQELGQRWADLSHRLGKLPPQTRVGIFVEHLGLAYPAYLATLGLRCCFIPLNPDFPDQRLADIIEDGSPAVMIVEEHLSDRLEKISATSKTLEHSPKIITTSLQLPKAEFSMPALGNGDDLAYLMFTSGTTGRPKGVMVTQNNLLSFIDWASKEYSIGPKDRLSQHSRVSFDLSIFDIFGALGNGACLCPIESKMDLAFPGNFLASNQISICLAVPGVIGTMERAGQLKNLDLSLHLRHLLVCGEALSPSLAKTWITHQANIPLHNLYGPTEATVACTHHKVEPADFTGDQSSISIGQSTTDTKVLILDPITGTESPEGVVGALHLAGDQLGPGYWKNSEQTKKVFLDGGDLFSSTIYNTGDLALRDSDGQLYWMGRQDQQVNIMGYRVELPEIEGHIARCSSLDPFAVIATGDPMGINLVITSRDLKSDPAEQLKALQQELGKVLPSYMWPTSLLAMEELPRNSNGKIDRKAIAAHFEA